MLKTSLTVIFVLTLMFSITTDAQYLPGNLDTRKSPAKLQYDFEKPDMQNALYENDNLVFSFRDDRDVLTIYDKRNGYAWKSGLDIAFSSQIRDGLRNGLDIGFEPIEERMNITYTGIANSLIVVEYYDSSLGIKRLASAALEGVESNLLKVKDTDNHYVLDISYSEIDLHVKVHLYFTDKGYQLEILYDEITGDDKKLLAAVLLNPFLGASGGMHRLYDEETNIHGDPVKKPEIPGYVMVPDGPGSLIRFSDYSVALKRYQASIYGKDLAKDTNSSFQESGQFVPFKSPSMPVYGIAHGKRQAAFVGYASKGDPYMELVVMPAQNTTLYTFAYPRFVYNSTFYQIFNKAGEGYFTLANPQNKFDIRFHYDFLSGSGETGYPADYVGMARRYRDFLLGEGVLKNQVHSYEDIPMQVDFIMSDLKKAVLGHEHVIMTTADQVQFILEKLSDQGILSMNAGLYGWQKNGYTSGKPWQTNWYYRIGRRRNFQELLDFGYSKEIDISFAQDYLNIHSKQVFPANNAVKHQNSWFLQRNISEDVPFRTFYYASPEKSTEWFENQVADLKNLGIRSHTIDGISKTLLSDHGRRSLSVEDTLKIYQNSLADSKDDLLLNLVTPNQYLWSYTDRYLQAPMFHSQHLIQTDTVPFLQLVLNGTMEIYGPYGNFSFSDQKDVLRLIDYNTYPTYVLTYEPAHYLSTTNSMSFYSTGYTQYTDLMESVYSQVNEALSQVIDAIWIDRVVLENGLIKNTYSNGIEIYINYSKQSVLPEGLKENIPPLSFHVEKNGGAK